MSGTIILNFIGIFIIFASVVFLAYAGTRFFGLKAGKIMKGKNINIVESVNLGLDKQLHLVRVGEKFILLSSSGKNIQMLTDIEARDIGEISVEKSDETMGIDFKSMFEKYVGMFQKKDRRSNNRRNSENTVPGKVETSKPSTGGSLERIREINNKLKKPYSDSEDKF